jgi:hypothetical protein
MGKGGPEGLFGATTLATGFLDLAAGRAEAFFFEGLGAFRERAFAFFFALDFLAMKFRS